MKIKTRNQTRSKQFKNWRCHESLLGKRSCDMFPAGVSSIFQPWCQKNKKKVAGFAAHRQCNMHRRGPQHGSLQFLDCGGRSTLHPATTTKSTRTFRNHPRPGRMPEAAREKSHQRDVSGDCHWRPWRRTLSVAVQCAVSSLPSATSTPSTAPQPQCSRGPLSSP